VEQAFPGVTYRPRSHDFARYLADPVDDVIRRVVERTVSGDRERSELRSDLDWDACYSLLTFADRMAVTALRTRQPSFAESAIHALTLVTRDKIDYRDLSVDFPLLALRESGGDIQRAIEFALERSEPGTRSAFRARAGSAKKVSLADCMYIEVRSRYGLGFMDTWGDPAPRRDDLPALAVAIADRIDAGGKYEVESLRLSALPTVWLGLDPRQGVDLPGFGGVSVSADLRGSPRWSHGLLVFLSDQGDETSARAVADIVRGASDADRPRTAISRGSLVLSVIGGSSTGGQKAVETVASLAAIRDDLAQALGDPPPVRPHVTFSNAD
jgi:hypothetical protein